MFDFTDIGVIFPLGVRLVTLVRSQERTTTWRENLITPRLDERYQGDI